MSNEAKKIMIVNDTNVLFETMLGEHFEQNKINAYKST